MYIQKAKNPSCGLFFWYHFLWAKKYYIIKLPASVSLDVNSDASSLNAAVGAMRMGAALQLWALGGESLFWFHGECSWSHRNPSRPCVRSLSRRRSGWAHPRTRGASLRFTHTLLRNARFSEEAFLLVYLNEGEWVDSLIFGAHLMLSFALMRPASVTHCWSCPPPKVFSTALK
jgi:hypothetical protein